MYGHISLSINYTCVHGTQKQLYLLREVLERLEQHRPEAVDVDDDVLAVQERAPHEREPLPVQRRRVGEDLVVPRVPVLERALVDGDLVLDVPEPHRRRRHHMSYSLSSSFPPLHPAALPLHSAARRPGRQGRIYRGALAPLLPKSPLKSKEKYERKREKKVKK